MFDLFWTIFGLALALFAAPGPITVETMRRGMQRGFWPAFGVQAGAIAAELVWAAAVLWGIAPLVQRPAVQTLLTVAGTVFLLWMAWQALREARLAPVLLSDERATRNATLMGMAYAASNPLSAIFWLAVAALLAAQGITALRPDHWVVIALAYILGGLAWGVPVSAIAAWGRRFMRPRFWRWWHTLSGLALGTYGLHLLWSMAV